MQEGYGCVISPHVRWRYPELCKIGNYCIIDDYCYISAALELEEGVHISHAVTIMGGKQRVHIARYADIGPGVRICAASNDYLIPGVSGPTVPSDLAAPSVKADIFIGPGVLIGANSVILPGVQLPAGVAIGACSVVKPGEYRPGHVYCGIPATDIHRLRGHVRDTLAHIDQIVKARALADA